MNQPTFGSRVATILGMAAAAILFVLGLIVSFYLLIFALVLGAILFVIAYVRAKFSKKTPRDVFIVQTEEIYREEQPHGRTIEHENEKED